MGVIFQASQSARPVTVLSGAVLGWGGGLVFNDVEGAGGGAIEPPTTGGLGSGEGLK